MIPGVLVAILTFPGTIVHEWAHKMFCKWNGVSVIKVVYFRFGNPTGYVTHEKPTKVSQTFWISVGPLILNSIITIILGLTLNLITPDSFLYYFTLWLAFSIGSHSFPSDHDAKNVLADSREQIKTGGHSMYYLAYPFFGLIWLANKFSFFWFDFIYAYLLIYLSTIIK